MYISGKGAPGKTALYQPVQVVRSGDTFLPYPNPQPTNLASVFLVINGWIYGAKYIRVDATGVTWTSTAFSLDPDDEIFIRYF